MMNEENKLVGEEQTTPAIPDEDTDADSPLSAFETVAAPKEQKKIKRLSSNTRTLIIVVAIVTALAILLAVTLPLLSEGQSGSSAVGSTTESNPNIIPIFDRADEDSKEVIVKSVAIKNKKDTFTVRYNTQKKVYELVGYEDLSLGENEVQSLTDTATTFTAYDQIDTVGKLADYGLENPAVTVDITYKDGADTLLIGNNTPDENGYYATVKGKDAVYMVDATLAAPFLLHKGQYVETVLLAAPTVKDDDENGTAMLKELVIKGGPNNETLALRQAEKSDGIEYTYANYIMTKPYMRVVSDKTSDTLSSFVMLSASEAAVLHPTDADKKKYGFDKPYATLDITLAVQSVVEKETSSEDEEEETYYYNASNATVVVGSKDENGNYYVMLDDHNAIYLVSYASLSALAERTYDNTISELLFLKNIDDIGKVTITVDGKPYTLTLKTDLSVEDVDTKLTVTMDGKKLSTPDFRTLYSQMMSLARYGKVDSDPNGQPKYRLAIYNTDGSEHISFEFFVQTGSLYAVRTTEGELFSIKAADIDKLLKQIDNYVNGRAVTEN